VGVNSTKIRRTIPFFHLPPRASRSQSLHSRLACFRCALCFAFIAHAHFASTSSPNSLIHRHVSIMHYNMYRTLQAAKPFVPNVPRKMAPAEITLYCHALDGVSFPLDISFIPRSSRSVNVRKRSSPSVKVRGFTMRQLVGASTWFWVPFLMKQPKMIVDMDPELSILEAIEELLRLVCFLHCQAD
jgi:hypothetical protein